MRVKESTKTPGVAGTSSMTVQSIVSTLPAFPQTVVVTLDSRRWMGDIWSCNGRSCIETGYGSVVYGRLEILERNDDKTSGKDVSYCHHRRVSFCFDLVSQRVNRGLAFHLDRNGAICHVN